MSKNLYQFGHFSIDVRGRQLWRLGELASVSPMVFECMVYLLENRDRAVGRDELISAVWGKADATYSLLGQLIAKARRTLGGSGNDQSVICTVQRFGYRWMADVEAAEAIAEPKNVPEGTEPRKTDSATSRRWPLSLLLGVTALLASLALAFAIHVGWRSHDERPTSADASFTLSKLPNAVAVLPVEMAATTGEWAWVRLGLMDSIAERLRSAGQTVVPSENVVALARSGKGDRLRHIVLDITGARYVVLPSISREGNVWMVSLRLESTGGSKDVATARNKDITVAGHEAADRLLAKLGLPAPGRSRDALGDSGDELLARARAAALGDDLNEARRILETASPEIRRSPHFRQRLSQVDYRSGRLKVAEDRLAELVSELDMESAPQLRASVLNDLGTIAVYLEQPSVAERRFSEALLLLTNIDDTTNIGRAHMGNGIAHAMRGDYDVASAEFSLSRVAYGAAGDVIAMAYVDSNEAQLKTLRGHYSAAEEEIERAERTFDQLGARAQLISARSLEIEIALAKLDISKAIDIGRRSIDLLSYVQNPRARHSFRLQWARALTVAGQLTEAGTVFDELVHDVDPEQNGAPFVASINVHKAAIDGILGDSAAVLKLAAPTIDSLTQPQYASDRTRSWLMATRALRELGRSEEAAAEVRRFMNWANDSNDPSVELYAKLAQAEQTWSDRRYDVAGPLYDEALQQAVRTGVPTDLAEVAESYGSALLTQSAVERASAVIGQIAGFADQDFDCALLQARLYHALHRVDAWRTALDNAQRLAGERPIPVSISAPPTAAVIAERF